MKTITYLHSYLLSLYLEYSCNSQGTAVVASLTFTRLLCLNTVYLEIKRQFSYHLYLEDSTPPKRIGGFYGFLIIIFPFWSEISIF